jgi:hypothetical protein
LIGQAAEDAGCQEIASREARSISFAFSKGRKNAFPVAKRFDRNAERTAKLSLAELHGSDPKQVWGEPQNELYV